MGKFIVEPHFRLQEWVAEEKGYFRAEGLDYEFRELIRSSGGQHHNKGAKGAFQSIETGPRSRRELRLPLDGQRGGLERPRQALCRCLLSRAFGHFRSCRLSHTHAGRPRRGADLGRLPVGQPLFDDPGAGAVPDARRDQPQLRGRHAVSPPRAPDRGQEPGGRTVQRSLLPRRATRFPQGDRHHVHDRRHDQRRARSGGRPSLLWRSRRELSATSTCVRNSTRATTRTSFPSAITP